MEQTPIAVISGYLGAGKTTLLRNIIEDLESKFAIIMNEFGDIGIDADVVEGENVDMAELSGGCVCCSLTGEFEKAVEEIREAYNPEIIIVETTGVAEPDTLVQNITHNIENAKLDTLITVVDSDSMKKYTSVGRTGKIQIEMADVIVLNKTDLVDTEEIQEIKERIRKYNQEAPILEAEYGNVDIDLLFGIETERHVQKVHHEHESPFNSFIYKLPKKIDKEKFREFLKWLPKEIYRAKGFITYKEGETHFINYVSGRWNEEKTEKEKNTQMVFIGKESEKVEEKIKQKLEKIQDE